jgi:hypothetical protein
MYKKIKTELLFSIVTIAFSTNINAQTYTYDFMSGYDGWIGDFADYPLVRCKKVKSRFGLGEYRECKKYHFAFNSRRTKKMNNSINKIQL